MLPPVLVAWPPELLAPGELLEGEELLELDALLALEELLELAELDELLVELGGVALGVCGVVGLLALGQPVRSRQAQTIAPGTPRR